MSPDNAQYGKYITAGILSVVILISPSSCSKKKSVNYIPVNVERGVIKKYISATGTVYPRNRLEIIPSIAGRVERVLVVEGQKVRKGQVLAWMSSTERAALIDAARLQGNKQLKYWEEAYKPSPLIAPITGTVIVRDIEPGQTVMTSTAVLVIADRLVVQADVDETDIGGVRTGMKAEITLDPYPDTRVNGRVSHISYESKVTNNVTMYEVEVIPDTVPPVFRSGMSATINIIQQLKKNVLLLPIDVVMLEGNINYVLIQRQEGKAPERREIKLGISDETRVEVLEGITEDDRVLVRDENTLQPDKKNSTKKNPFLPTPPGRKGKTKR